MRRREFIAGLGGAAMWPSMARAQQGERVRRIAVLTGADENESKARISVFTQALADLGWTDGRNVRIDHRWGGDDNNRIQAVAQELVDLQPDIILTGGVPATAAVQRKTRTIPIVFTIVADPVASGLVARLNQPGGNITGFATSEPSMGGKWLELLSEIAPGLKRAAIMQGARPHHPLNASTSREIDAAFATLARERPDALFVAPDGFFFTRQVQIATLAARDRIPATYPNRTFVVAGGLMSSLNGTSPIGRSFTWRLI
jgi:putative tryptophan/tyrosine transport system substrate-binding protein